MDDKIQDMLNKSLISIERREMLTRIPVWFVALKRYDPDVFYWIKYDRMNRN